MLPILLSVLFLAPVPQGAPPLPSTGPGPSAASQTLPDWQVWSSLGGHVLAQDGAGDSWSFVSDGSVGHLTRYDDQGAVLWSATATNVQTAEAIAMRSNGSVVCGGNWTTSPWGAGWHGAVYCFDGSGTILWSQVFDRGTQDDIVDIVVDDQDVTYVLMQDQRYDIGGWGDIYLFAIDPAGGLLWEAVWTGQGTGYGYRDIPYDLALDPTLDRLYVVGATRTPAARLDQLILAYDTAGNLLWTWIRNGPALMRDKDWLSHVGVVPGGGLVATGRSPSTANNGFDVYTVRCDEDGNTIWEATHPSSGADESPRAFTSLPSGECFVATGTGRVLHYDSNGALLHDFHPLPTGYGHLQSVGLGVDSHGHLVAWGYAAKAGDFDCFLAVGDLSTTPVLVAWDVVRVAPGSDENVSPYAPAPPFHLDAADRLLVGCTTNAPGLAGGILRYTVP